MELNFESAAALVLVMILVYVLFAPVKSETQPTAESLPGYSVLHYFKIGTPVNKILLDPQCISRMMLEMKNAFGECFRMPLGFRMSVATANPEDIAFVVSNNAFFQKPKSVMFTMSDAAPKNIFVLDDREHRMLRKHFQNTFNSNLLSSFHTILGDCVLTGVNVLSKLCVKHGNQEGTSSSKSQSIQTAFTRNGYIDITRVLSIITVRAITTVCFGTSLPLETCQQFLNDTESLSNEMLVDVALYPIRNVLWQFPVLGKFLVRRRFTELKEKLRNSCRTFINDRLKEYDGQVSFPKSGETRDLMDSILKLGNVDIETIISHTMTFAIAGSLSSNQAISWAIYELCKPENAEAYSRVEKEVDSVSENLTADKFIDFETVSKLKYTRAVWKEALRMHAPAHIIARETLKDVTLPGTGVRLKKGTQVQTVPILVNCDERYHTRASMFDPSRWLQATPDTKRPPLGAYVPFGLGSRNCPGQFFADHEGVFVLAEVIRRFSLKLPCNPNEVVTCSGFVEIGKFSSRRDGNLDMGLPIIAEKRI